MENLFKKQPLAMWIGVFFLGIILVGLAITLFPLFCVVVGVGLVSLLVVGPKSIKQLFNRAERIHTINKAGKAGKYKHTLDN